MTSRRFGASGSSDVEVVGRAVEVGLQHGADVVEALFAQPAVDAQRRVDELRLLHVDADERSPRSSSCAMFVVRELLVDLEPEVRELQRDVRAQLLRGDALDASVR